MPIVIKVAHRDLLRSLSELLETEGDYGFVPEFNAKRPFGNSGDFAVGRDAAELLQMDGDSETDRELALRLLRECTPVLKYILAEADLDPCLDVEIDEQGVRVQ